MEDYLSAKLVIHVKYVIFIYLFIYWLFPENTFMPLNSEQYFKLFESLKKSGVQQGGVACRCRAVGAAQCSFLEIRFSGTRSEMSYELFYYFSIN